MKHYSPDLPEKSGFSAQEIADCGARRGLLYLALELSPILARSPIAHTPGFDGPEPAELSFQEIRDVIRQAHELGGRRIMILSDLAADPLEQEVIAFVGELGMELEIGPRNPGPTSDGCALESSFTGQGCMRHGYSCVVSRQGQVYPCVGLLIPLGDVHTESLGDILRQSEVIENLLKHRKMIKEPCRNCRDAEYCYGCRGAAFMATGDYLAPDPTCPRVQGVLVESLPAAVASLIPHGPTMQMIDRLTQVGERQATAEYCVADTCPFVDGGGRLDETVYVELIAQTLAACQGFHPPGGEKNLQSGLLLGVKDLQIAGEARVGDQLCIRIRKTLRYGGFGVAEGVVCHRDGREVARGELKVWQASTDSMGVFG